MEIIQSALKIENLIKETEDIFEKLNKSNNILLKNIIKIEEHISKLDLLINEYFTKIQSIGNENKRSLLNYLNNNYKEKNDLEIEFKNRQIEILNQISESIKNMKADIYNNGISIEKIKDLKDNINTLKSMIEKDIMLNIELNKKPPVEKIKYVYDIPPQLINNLNSAFQNVCMAKEGIEKIKVFDDIINNLQQIQ
ncbi:hypothetical protein ACETAC_00140 [Aceticella autotrophica]|uniref:Uncharacterized protein n=1 Tax=Aceticella autotrophica TaxID=2755338 RepID=A0A975AVU2_9THEO|nr:hypothetical protein [Aceticella autotrophica]QSZ27394.1 hypothetical protein ACETAC_00140 [Aceticella autotrophica]